MQRGVVDAVTARDAVDDDVRGVPEQPRAADREHDGADREDQGDDGTLPLGSEIREEPAGRAAEVLGVLDRHPDAEAVAGVERPLEDGLGSPRRRRALQRAGRARSIVAHADLLRLRDELGFDDLLVGRTALEQLGVGAEPDLAALFEDEDLVGLHDRRHALGDDDVDGVGDDGRQRGTEPGVGREVEGREGVVEEVDVGVVDERAGDGQALALAARDVRRRPARSGRRGLRASPRRSHGPGRSRAPARPRLRRRRDRRSGRCSRRCPRRGTASGGRGRSPDAACRGRCRGR